jgi:DNA mismatch repair protein MutS
VSEHLHNAIGCKTIFATHYHELTQLADELPAVRNFTVAVREVGDEILFLHSLRPGGADRSYGIEVGRLAGIPRQVLARARQVLKLLESGHLIGGRAAAPAADSQLGLFAAAPPHPVLAALRELDVDELSPRQALERLAQLVDEARQARS